MLSADTCAAFITVPIAWLLLKLKRMAVRHGWDLAWLPAPYTEHEHYTH